jgi:UDP-3-O-[3-hydroxymyristoyl] N-acetylglucosamine deacetylase
MDEGSGINFAFATGCYPVSDAIIDGSMRCTSLMFPGGERVGTVEHLMSAVAGVGLDDVLITPDGEELPIMDGSPLPFARAMTSEGFRESGEPYATPALAAPLCVDFGASSVAAVPSDELRLTYVIDYPGSAIGTEMKDAVLSGETFISELAPARTFCLRREVDALLASGRGLGGGAGNVLVVEDGEPPSYRVDRECAAHKAADLLGDLMTAGFVARAHYICVRGGHALHAKLVDRIRRIF